MRTGAEGNISSFTHGIRGGGEETCFVVWKDSVALNVRGMSIISCSVLKKGVLMKFSFPFSTSMCYQTKENIHDLAGPHRSSQQRHTVVALVIVVTLPNLASRACLT